jgi:hypothetical protein
MMAQLDDSHDGAGAVEKPMEPLEVNIETISKASGHALSLIGFAQQAVEELRRCGHEMDGTDTAIARQSDELIDFFNALIRREHFSMGPPKRRSRAGRKV